MSLKSAAQSFGNFLKVGIFGACLASPVIGAVVGGVAGGIVGAAVGLFAGPVAAVGGLMAMYGAGRLVRFIQKTPVERKAAIQNFNARKATHETVSAFGRGLSWAVNLSTFVATLGRGGTNFDWGSNHVVWADPNAPLVEDNPQPAGTTGADTKTSTVPSAPLTNSFDTARNADQKPAANSTADHSGKKPNAQKPAL